MKTVHAVYGIFKDSKHVKETLKAAGVTYWCAPSSKTYWDERTKSKIRYDEEIGIETEHQLSLEVTYTVSKEAGLDENGKPKREKLQVHKTVGEYLKKYGKKLK